MEHERKSYGYLQDHVRQHQGNLTPPELAVVHWLAAGYNVPMIAEELVKEPSTIRTQIRSAMAKLNAKTQAHLVACAFREGLVD